MTATPLIPNGVQALPVPVTATLTFNLSDALTGQELAYLMKKAEDEGISIDALLVRQVRAIASQPIAA
jgi:hypothetical protein